MSADLATSSVLDTGRLVALKRQAKAGDPAAAKEVARQFESLFMQMVLKSMRDAVPREGLFDSDASRLYQSLHDQQLSLQLGGGRGLGLAAMIERQLTQGIAPATPPLGPLPLRREPTGIPLESTSPRALRGLTVVPATPHAGKAGLPPVAVPPAPTSDAAVPGLRQPPQFTRGLPVAAYSTDPTYATTLGRIIGAGALRQAIAI
jgi:flagellar protein FlgJ